MDTLEEANNRLLARREQLVNTQTYKQKPLSTTILDIQEKIKAIAEERRGWLIESKERAEKFESDKKKFLADSKKSNYDNYIVAAGIPKKFMAAQAKEDGRSLFVTGSFGTGKTHYAIAAMKYYIDNLPDSCFVQPFNRLPAFITVPELLLKIRSVFSLQKCEDEIVDKYANVALLVLDDLGAEKTTEFSLQTLYIILNRRYNEQLQTIITSNLTLDEVKDRLGDRIASRVAGMCSVLKIVGKDRRLVNKQKGKEEVEIETMG